MPLPVAPDPISLGDLQTNFGGTDPASLSEYYRGGTQSIFRNCQSRHP